MKKGTLISFILLLGISIALTYYFTKKSDRSRESLPESAENAEIKFKDTVHLHRAQQYIQNYITACDTFISDTVPIRSYSIHKADLLGMFGVTSVPGSVYDHCRVYLGIDDSSKFRLFMTPANCDKTKSGLDSVVDAIPFDGRHYYVYDLNAPCPSTCDLTSPLYTLKPYKR